MFRRLAEAFQDDDGSHSQYMKGQNTYFNTLPNIILSGTSGLKGFDTAIQSLDSMGQNYQPPAVKNPNDIFMRDSSPDLNAMAKQCSASSLDQLIAIKNPNAAIGCGWLYTPPNKGSPYPVVSQGFIGNSDGPLQTFSPPDYKKYFFDLQLAKKQMLLDKCKALKACTDVDSEVFNGTCGYCTDTNQGVPIDTVGQSLYGNDPIGACSPQSIVTSGQNCPPPPGSGPGPQPIIDKTCEPVNGRLSSACLYNQVLAGGCNDRGSLAIALSGSPSPSDYIASIRDGDAVKIYNRVANPPLKLDIFTQGATTVDQVLTEVRQLAGNTKLPSNTGTGAAARDLCLQKGAINSYNFCLDLPDTTTSPFDVGCLQQIFRKLGGQPTGTAYPQSGNINTYNSMGNLGAVKQYLNSLIQNMSSSDYNTQRNAMLQFLGIQPEKLIQRVPYQQGVEVIWLLAHPGQSNSIWGILKRTIETDIVQFDPSRATSPIAQLASTYPGFTQQSAMIQMFDVRAPNNFATNFQITIDDAFFMAANQPADIAKLAFSSSGLNQLNLFSNMGIQGPTAYGTAQCFNYYGATPNITKIYYSDSGGGGHTLQLTVNPCSGNPSFLPPYYSLTCESGAPFLNFEVLADGSFDDTRNAGLYASLISQGGLEVHNRPEERNNVPGNKGFVRLTNNSSSFNITNLAYQAWGTITFAFRLQSMPVKEGIFGFKAPKGYVSLYLIPINGNQAQLRLQTNLWSNVYGFANGDGATPVNLQIGTWYFLEVAQNGQGFDMYCDSIDNIIQNGKYTTQYFQITNNGQSITTNNNYGLYAQNIQDCGIGIGGPASGFSNYTSSFQFDVAWMHVYDYYIGANEILKDCKAAWQFTQFPDSVNSYRTI